MNFEGYILYEGLDSYYNDIGHYPDKTVDELKQLSDLNEECVGFNTLGWLKSKICDVTDLQPFNGNLYVKNNKNNKDIINCIKNKLLESKNREVVNNLTFTVTTCKRFDRFKDTIDNLLLMCKDIDIVDRWLCIDDNSSVEDREQMQKEYPFFDFIFKDVTQKGHAKSMNILWLSVKTDFIMHFEDDWRCYEPFSINQMLDVVKSGKIDQIVLRKNSWSDHIPFTKVQVVDSSKTVYRYVYNHYHTVKPELNQKYDSEVNLNIKLLSKNKNSMYWWWPGFSLNPSLLNLTKIKQKKQNFNEDIMQELFEYDYALRLYKENAIIGYIDLQINHTGDVSSYLLNDMKRYYDF